MKGPLSAKRFKVGKYGAGTLWHERDGKGGAAILFGTMKIAERHKGGPWISVEPAWNVTTPDRDTELWVQHNGGEGVFVSLHGGRGK
jgi:hypothetical protein